MGLSASITPEVLQQMCYCAQTVRTLACLDRGIVELNIALCHQCLVIIDHHGQSCQTLLLFLSAGGSCHERPVITCCRFATMPRPQRLLPQKRPAAALPLPAVPGLGAQTSRSTGASTIDRYYLSRHCAVCTPPPPPSSPPPSLGRFSRGT